VDSNPDVQSLLFFGIDGVKGVREETEGKVFTEFSRELDIFDGKEFGSDKKCKVDEFIFFDGHAANLHLISRQDKGLVPQTIFL
jgi:hypothetical protein